METVDGTNGNGRTEGNGRKEMAEEGKDGREWNCIPLVSIVSFKVFEQCTSRGSRVTNWKYCKFEI